MPVHKKSKQMEQAGRRSMDKVAKPTPENTVHQAETAVNASFWGEETMYIDNVKWGSLPETIRIRPLDPEIRRQLLVSMRNNLHNEQLTIKVAVVDKPPNLGTSDWNKYLTDFEDGLVPAQIFSGAHRADALPEYNKTSTKQAKARVMFYYRPPAIDLMIVAAKDNQPLLQNDLLPNPLSHIDTIIYCRKLAEMTLYEHLQPTGKLITIADAPQDMQTDWDDLRREYSNLNQKFQTKVSQRITAYMLDSGTHRPEKNMLAMYPADFKLAMDWYRAVLDPNSSGFVLDKKFNPRYLEGWFSKIYGDKVFSLANPFFMARELLFIEMLKESMETKTLDAFEKDRRDTTDQISLERANKYLEGKQLPLFLIPEPGARFRKRPETVSTRDEAEGGPSTSKASTIPRSRPSRSKCSSSKNLTVTPSTQLVSPFLPNAGTKKRPRSHSISPEMEEPIAAIVKAPLQLAAAEVNIPTSLGNRKSTSKVALIREKNPLFYSLSEENMYPSNYRNVERVESGGKDNEDPRLRHTKFVFSCPPCQCRPDMLNQCSDEVLCSTKRMEAVCDPDICPAKNNCSNNVVFNIKFQKKVKLSPTDRTGFGLFATFAISKKEFIIEYKGEVISQREKEERLCAKYEIKDTVHYIMEFPSDEQQPMRYLDSEFFGNYARFINSSCRPNCIARKAPVRDEMHILIYALRDIAPDEELTYEYHYDFTKSSEELTSLCRLGQCQCNRYDQAK